MGIARTQSPTFKNYAFELPTFRVTAEANPAECIGGSSFGKTPLVIKDFPSKYVLINMNCLFKSQYDAMQVVWYIYNKINNLSSILYIILKKEENYKN